MRPIGRRKSPKRRQRRMKQGGFEEAARLAAPSGDGNRNAATVYAAMVIAGQCPPLSSSQSPLSSVSLAVTSSASLVPAMLARTRSLRCSGSPHHAGRGGDPNAKTASAPLHPKGTSAPTSWAWALLLSPPRRARRGPHIGSCQKRSGPYPQGVCRSRKRQSRRRLRSCYALPWRAATAKLLTETQVLAGQSGPRTGMVIVWVQPDGKSSPPHKWR